MLPVISSLPPAPDFRYVGLEPGPPPGARLWASLAASGATLGAGILHEMGPKAAALVVIGASAATLALRTFGRRRAAGRVRSALVRAAQSAKVALRGDAVAMAIVPWGVLVQQDLAPRILRWAAVRSVNVEMTYGRDGMTPTTLWSVVTIETDHERLAGQTAGAVAIERLIAHVDAYAEEQAQPVALDLEGRHAAGEPFEPVVEPLLSAARACVAGAAPDTTRLGLQGGYRTNLETASDETLAVLHGVLADRAPKSPDPRPLAAVLAAELHAVRLLGDLVSLVQSPHPVLAAVAKVAANKLGAVATKVGAVAEVAPFLHERDVEALCDWGR